MAIVFHIEDVQYSLKGKKKLKEWITQAVLEEKKTPGDISIILCSDEYLLGINQKYLAHDYFTDIITFDYSAENRISGDLFISLERVSENAQQRHLSLESELYRVMIHGVMHLCGYSDKSKTDSKTMRQKEDHYLKKILR